MVEKKGFVIDMRENQSEVSGKVQSELGHQTELGHERREERGERGRDTVSYTHLTLPTTIGV
jgi:hypothetical protein